MTTWKNRIRSASFRGVPFHIEDSNAVVGGRKSVTHEFPGAENYLVEDMGLRPQSFSINGFVVGDDYQTKRDAIVAAANKPNAGTLVHPYFGNIQVLCTKCDVSEKKDEGGVARFSMEFLRTKALVFPSFTIDLKQQLLNTSGTILSSIIGRFATNFLISGVSTLIEDDASLLLKTTAEELSKQFPGTESSTALNHIAQNPGGYIRNPAGFSEITIAAFKDISTNYAGTAQFNDLAFGTFATGLMEAMPKIPNVQSQSRTQQRANRNALKSFLTQAGIAIAIEASTAISFETRDKVLSFRDKIADSVRTFRLDNTNIESEGIVQEISDYAAQSFRYLTEEAPNLTKARAVAPLANEPPIVALFRNKGNAEGIDDMVKRNNLDQILWTPPAKREQKLDIW